MEALSPQKMDILERVSRVITLAVFAVAFLFTLAAPILAISWSKIPFPGFLVEQTLVVNDRIGEGGVGGWRACGLLSM